jgi:hypothetical protein
MLCRVRLLSSIYLSFLYAKRQESIVWNSTRARRFCRGTAKQPRKKTVKQKKTGTSFRHEREMFCETLVIFFLKKKSLSFFIIDREMTTEQQNKKKISNRTTKQEKNKHDDGFPNIH